MRINNNTNEKLQEEKGVRIPGVKALTGRTAAVQRVRKWIWTPGTGNLAKVCLHDWARHITYAGFCLLSRIYVDCNFFSSKHITRCVDRCLLLLQCLSGPWTLILSSTAKSSTHKPKIALFLNPQYALNFMFFLATEARACGMQYFSQAESPIALPIWLSPFLSVLVSYLVMFIYT